MKKYTRELQILAALGATVVILSGCGGGGTTSATADTTAPTITVVPSVSGTTDIATTLSVTVNENATGYYLVQLAAASAPTATAVQAGTSFAMTANVAATQTVSALTFNTAYNIYFVAKDAANNVQTAVQNVAVTTQAGYVAQGGLIWTPDNIGEGVTYATSNPGGHWFTWPEANAYCASFSVNGVGGWRLPTLSELSALYASGAMNGQAWTLYYTWSSDLVSAGSHYSFGLGDGVTGNSADTLSGKVSCVR